MNLTDRTFKKDEIRTLVIQALSLLKAPACILDDSENYIELLSLDKSCDPLMSSQTLKHMLVGYARDRYGPCVYYDSSHIFFLIFTTGHDITRKYIVSGPLTVNYVAATELKDYMTRHNVTSDAIVQHTISGIKHIGQLLTFLLYDKGELKDPVFTLSDCIDDTTQSQSLSAVMHYHIDINAPHNSHDYEKDIRKAIARGDEENILDIIHAPFAGVRGKIALNELRNVKNLAIVDITIISREAIDSGLSSEHIYSIGDAFILRIEKARSIEEVSAIYDEAAISFAHEVKTFKSGTALPPDERIKKAMAFIDKTIAERIKVTDIAAHLKISTDYLQDLFQKHMHISVAAYVQRQKIEKAKLLIKNTDMKIEEISMSLGFANSSNFVTFFKKALNISPLKYRNLSDTRDIKTAEKKKRDEVLG